MLFTSLSFALFLPIVFILYWFGTRGNLRLQNILLLVASYYFYACWDFRFLFLLMFSTLLDYFTGIKMHEAKQLSWKKFWFWLSISVNLGFLGVFKYYNFFATSFAEGVSMLGFKADVGMLQVILPVGISFYTFHGLSYVIDIYKERIQPERNFIDYSVFVSFFPLLVAGPIERATHLLPQILQKREFSYTQAVDGLRQILWGLFKKVVIADNCAWYANTIFNDADHYGGSTLVMGAFFFTLLIYGDFSGYSDIAQGTARLFGFELLRNFSYPYFSRDIAEFWRRWHISLSSWFRDYLYIPLGGSKGGTWMKIRNTMIIFLVSGFWHGANWTFLIWGLLNALYILPSILRRTNRNHLDIAAAGKLFPSLREIASMGLTFTLTAFAWIFFRATSLERAGAYVGGIFDRSLFTMPAHFPLKLLALIMVFFTVEWLGREQLHPLRLVEKIQFPSLRIACYYAVIGMLLVFGVFEENQFIYFQF